jgi:glutathione S-transferase
MPGGQLPVLEVYEWKISQSLSIARFLANKFDLAGISPLENAEADMIVEFSKDFYDSKYHKFTKAL